MRNPILLLLLLVTMPTLTHADPPPAAARRPVVTAYQGVQITDDYRWLEDARDPAVRAWAEAQNAHTRKLLDALPGSGEIRARVSEVLKFPSPAWFSLAYEGGRLFAMKFQPPKEQSVLVLLGREPSAAQEKVVLDPTVLDPQGHTTIDFYEPSPDGKKVAVSLSHKGTEAGDVHVYDVDSGKEIGPAVPRAHTGTAGGTLAWSGDASGFYYTRHPLPGERAPEDIDFYQQVYFHKLGDDPKNDRYEIGRDFPRIAESFLSTAPGGKHVANLVQDGDGGRFILYLLDVAARRWTRVADYEDQVKSASFGKDGKLYLQSVKGAPRGQILRLDPARPELAGAEVVVPQGEGVLAGFQATRSRLYVASIIGGPMRLDVYPIDQQPRKATLVPTLPVGTVGGITALEGDDVLFAQLSYLDPGAWYRYDARSGAVARTTLTKKSAIDTSGFEVLRETATSKDGTTVPLSIIQKKGTRRDGQNPTLLNGYGGFGVSLPPSFNASLLLFVEQGGVVAIANLRGGGEFGEPWHLAGNLTRKQNVFDDFHAVARHLQTSRVTSPKKLSILGGSNGGLLMGAALTQHPEAYAAVVAQVGIYDMLRVESDPNGAFNVTEYGTVKDKAQFEALHAYSPLHRVKDGASYPPVMFTTGLNDPRVKSYHSFKMVARLQAADPRGQFLLRINANAGHGAGKLSDAIEQQVDVLAFLFKELGVKYKGRVRG